MKPIAVNQEIHVLKHALECVNEWEFPEWEIFINRKDYSRTLPIPDEISLVLQVSAEVYHQFEDELLEEAETGQFIITPLTLS